MVKLAIVLVFVRAVIRPLGQILKMTIGLERRVPGAGKSLARMVLFAVRVAGIDRRAQKRLAKQQRPPDPEN
jgi:hypothetical protein